MNGFYVSMVFLGALLVIFSLVCIFLDKRKAFNCLKSYDDKTQKLVEIINDAEQMINELNRFSDYIVSQMDVKNEELNNKLKLAEEKMDVLNEKAGMICNGTGKTAVQEGNECRKGFPVETKNEISFMEASNVEVTGFEADALVSSVAVAVNGGAIDTAVTAAAPYFKYNSNYVSKPAKKKEKVVPINNKCSEVIKLSREGMQGLEIAKRLNMGKGEVELILGLRK